MIEVPGNGNRGTHTIVVEIKASRKLAGDVPPDSKTAKDFPGQDGLKIRFPGQTFTMTFPEGCTDFCDDLVESLEKIPGIIRVYGK